MKTVDIFWTKIYIFGICNMLAIQINHKNLGFLKKIFACRRQLVWRSRLSAESLMAGVPAVDPPAGVSWSRRLGAYLCGRLLLEPPVGVSRSSGLGV